MAYTGITISGWAHSAGVLEPVAEKMHVLSPVHLLSSAQLQRHDTYARDAAADEPEREQADGEDRAPMPSQRTHLPARTRALGQCIESAEAPVVLVGWSAGSMLALEAAVAFPDHVVALVLLSATACFHQNEACPWGTSPGTLRAMARRLDSTPEPVLDDFFRRSVSPGECTSADIDDKIGQALAEEVAVLQEGLAFLQHHDLTPLLSRVQQPCLLMHGKQDEVIAPQAMKYLHAHLRRSATVSLAYTGHALPEQQSETVAIYGNQFLEGLRGE